MPDFGDFVDEYKKQEREKARASWLGEVKEFNRYVEEAKALGIDLPPVLALLLGTGDRIYFTWEKNRYEVHVSAGGTFRALSEIEFISKKGSRKFEVEPRILRDYMRELVEKSSSI